jgi:hypothetical protein
LSGLERLGEDVLVEVVATDTERGCRFVGTERETGNGPNRRSACRTEGRGRVGRGPRGKPVGGQTSANHAAETRLLVELEQLDWLHAPSGIERLEAVVGRERLSQLLLLVALWPEDEDLFGRSLPATQAA